MSRRRAKLKDKASKYRSVFWVKSHGAKSSIRSIEAKPWEAKVQIDGLSIRKRFPTEREAAIQVDKWVLEYRLDAPLNILKPKP